MGVEKGHKKSPWHNNHLPYIVKERTYLLGSTPCVHASRPRSLDFFSRWCPSGASNFRPDMAAQSAKLHEIVSLIRIVCLIRLQGCQGCQKIGKTKLKTTLVSWSTKIQPKLNEIKKTFRKQSFFDIFCSILTVLTVSSNLAES